MEDVSYAIANAITVILLVMAIGRVQNSVLMYIHRSLIVKNFGAKVGNFIANRLTFLGVIVHESSHAVLAILTGAKIRDITFFTTRGSSILGNVQFQPRGGFILESIQCTLASLAPLLLGIPLEIYLINLLPSMNNLYTQIFIIYAIISIWYHLRLSQQDIKVAVKGLPLSTILISCIFYLSKYNLIGEIELWMNQIK